MLPLRPSPLLLHLLATLSLVSAPLLAQDVLLEVRGESAGEFRGSLVNSAGDVDGDGTMDLLVYRRSPEEAGVDVVELFSGATATRLHAWTFPGFSGPRGSMTGLGDVDGDGTPDIGFGYRSVHEAAARIVSGATFEVLYEHPGVPSGGSVLVQSPIAVRGVGDVNGDGFADYVIGDAEWALPGSPAVGHVRGFSGRTGSQIYAVPGPGAGPAGSVEGFGGQVVTVGDVDGDGRQDWLALEDRGSGVSLHSGVDGSLIHLHDEPGFESIAAVGRWDADPVPDYAVGQPQWGLGQGRAWIYSGATGDLLKRVVPTIGGNMANTMAGVDVDGDGRSELVLSGGVGQLQVLDRDGNPLGQNRAGNGPFEREPFRLAFVQPGDVDGDGAQDLLVGGIAGFHGPGTGGAQILSLVGDCDGDGILDVLEVDAGAPDCNGNRIPDGCDIASGSSQDTDGDGVPDECGGFFGIGLCAATPNSTGLVARLDAWGGTSIAQGTMTLGVWQAPAHQPGLFVLGAPDIPGVPFGQGTLCLDQPLRFPPVALNALGAAGIDLDFGAYPASGIQPGAAVGFQFWFRDPAAGSGAFDLSELGIGTMAP